MFHFGVMNAAFKCLELLAEVSSRGGKGRWLLTLPRTPAAHNQAKENDDQDERKNAGDHSSKRPCASDRDAAA
jgi:hypothetical protein